MPDEFTIVGLGEALFDIFPDGRRLGGAPLNVAVHAHQLGRACQPRQGRGGRGGRGMAVSRVGQDELGRILIDELHQRDMDARYIQTDPDRPTGRVFVRFVAAGEPHYDIAANAAWDVLQYDFDLEDLTQTCEAVCFGSLAQRHGLTRSTIYRFLDACPHAVRMFDVNLRYSAGKPCYDRQIIRRSCRSATIVKLNEEELPIVAELAGVAASEASDAASSDGNEKEDCLMRALIDQFELEMAVLTRGGRGTRIYTADGQVFQGDRVSYPAAADADAVGAGDACAAAVLVGRLMHLPPPRLVMLANHAGAYVVSQPGATPALPEEVLVMGKG